MRRPTRGEWIALGVAVGVVAVVVTPGGTLIAAAVAKGIDMLKARGRRAFMAQVGGEVARQLEELRPDLDPVARREAAAIVAAQASVETNDGKTPAWAG